MEMAQLLYICVSMGALEKILGQPIVWLIAPPISQYKLELFVLAHFPIGSVTPRLQLRVS